ncbi:hypothetical protein ACL02T_23610 [Pseudonocardia sp. RS010]|uniref:hypothetical protein n=1 Tax=Pseudonocardia sp. RS010 TaxID=3385979 RepID=UPI00399F4C2D
MVERQSAQSHPGSPGDDTIASTDPERAPAPRGPGSRGTARWVVVGALAGFLAGVGFAALHSWFAVSTGAGALAPFRRIATIVQGPPPDTDAIWVGMLVHSLIAAVLGVIFAGVLLPMRRRSAGWLAWAGLVFGAAVYLVDFQVLARTIPQFSAFQQVSQPFELAAHLVFGALLATFAVLAKPRAATRT